MAGNIFEEVRNAVTISQAIEYLGLKPTETKGDQLRFPCPACKGNDKRTLSVNLSKGFRCFSGDKKGDDATALVAHCKGIRNGAAAQELKDQFLLSSTKPARETAKAEGRKETGNGFLPLESSHPVIEMLGLQSELLEAMDAGFDGERILIPLRKANGEEVMTLRIATRADQVPLLLFSESVKPVAKPEPDELRKMFRVV
jgi:hypothetical protein